MKDILETIDHLEVYQRTPGKRPLLLVDGHHSRLEYEFVNYINNTDHLWSVCIGVPYCTDLWQVGDAAEQNGALNIASVVEKRKIMQEKENVMYNRPTIEPYDIMRIVNEGWKHSFARVDSNKKAIAERGWFPFNRYLMTNTQVRSSITEQEQANEQASTSRVVLPVHTLLDMVQASDRSEPSIDPSHLPTQSTGTANFSSGIASWCLDMIVQDHDINAARGRIKQNMETGKSLKDKLNESKKITAGRLFKAGSCRIGQTIFDIHKERRTKQKQDNIAAQTKAKNIYLLSISQADEVHRLEPDATKWNTADLKVVLKSLKTKEDGAMPKTKDKMLQSYYLWKDRPRMSFAVPDSLEVEEVHLDPVEDETNEQELSAEEEAISAMMDLGGYQAV